MSLDLVYLSDDNWFLKPTLWEYFIIVNII